MYYYRGDYIVGSGMHDDRRMLFDLANEALQSLVVAESSRGGCASSLRQWVVDSTGVARGKKLVDDVWQQVSASISIEHVITLPRKKERKKKANDCSFDLFLFRIMWNFRCKL